MTEADRATDEPADLGDDAQPPEPRGGWRRWLSVRVDPLGWRAETVLAHLAIQIFSVAVGAFIAIDLTERSSSRATRQLSDVALALLVEEISENRETLRENLKGREAFSTRLKALSEHIRNVQANEEETTEADFKTLKTKFSGDWRIAWDVPLSGAWDVALASGSLQVLGPKLLTVLSNIYILQAERPRAADLLRQFSEGFSSIVLLRAEQLTDAQRRSEVAHAALTMHLHMDFLNTLDRELLDAYDAALEALGRKLSR